MKQFQSIQVCAMRLAFLALALALSPLLKSQQLAIGNNHIFNPGWVNPGHVSGDNLLRGSALYQHRNLASIGFKSTSQFLDFKSNGLGKKRAFGFGMNIGTDFEHTETRLNFGLVFGAKVIQTDLFHVGVGMNVGMVNWGSNYTDIPVYQQGDPILNRQASFTDLDAGLGLNFGMQTYTVRATFDVWGRQLPGAFLSGAPKGGGVLAPHAYAAAKVLYNVGPDIFIGPMALYHNTVSNDRRIGGIGGGTLDAGLKLELDRPRLWAGAAYRLGNAAVTGNFGMQIFGTDTADGRKQVANFLDFTFSTSYPLNSASMFGPSAEVGLLFSFGQVGTEETERDSLDKMRGAFWSNNGNMDTHKDRYLKSVDKAGLLEIGGIKATTDLTPEFVFLEYEWEDMHYMYSGYDLTVNDTNQITWLGTDWVGMDSMVVRFVEDVVREGLMPVHTDYEDRDSVEPLKVLISIDLAAKLKFDQNAAQFGAAYGDTEITYGGELGYNTFADSTLRSTGDSLYIKIRYADTDTMIAIRKGKEINNLELSALKLFAMQRRMEYELYRTFGSEFVLIDRDEKKRIDDALSRNKKVVYTGRLEVIPNNPNQEPFQVFLAGLEFGRNTSWVPIVEKRKDRTKKNSDKVTRRRGRNWYRDPVEDSN